MVVDLTTHSRGVSKNHSEHLAENLFVKNSTSVGKWYYTHNLQRQLSMSNIVIKLSQPIILEMFKS